MLSKQEYPECDNIECVEFATKYYIDKGEDGYNKDDRKSNLSNFYHSIGIAPIQQGGCDRSNPPDEVECMQNLVYDMGMRYKNRQDLMDDFAEIVDWDYLGALCKRCED